MKAVVAAFNQEKALVGAFSVTVQLHRLIVYSTSDDSLARFLALFVIVLDGSPGHTLMISPSRLFLHTQGFLSDKTCFCHYHTKSVCLFILVYLNALKKKSY